HQGGGQAERQRRGQLQRLQRRHFQPSGRGRELAQVGGQQVARLVLRLLQLGQASFAGGELALLGEQVEFRGGAQLVAGAGELEDLALVVERFPRRGHFLGQGSEVERGVHHIASDGQAGRVKLVAGQVDLRLRTTRHGP